MKLFPVGKRSTRHYIQNQNVSPVPMSVLPHNGSFLLTTIFGPKNAIPSIAAACLQCWALFLSGFKHNISFKNTKLYGNADMLSRLPSLSVCNPAHEDPLEVHLLSMVDDHLPVTL